MATPIPENRASFDLDAVARATRGELRAGAGRVSGVVIDSRAVRPGCLFVALRGPRHDAHRFVPAAVSAGAAAVLVARDAELPAALDAAVVAVDDTERALGDLAAAYRGAWRGTVVAITGSAGKTSTRSLAAAALEAAGATVLETVGNLNNTIGVPMTLFGLAESMDTAVVELGTNRPGEIARLADIAQPDVGVVTLVAAAHTEGLGSVEAVAEEKAALLVALPPAGAAVINADDDALGAWTGRVGSARRVLFGKNAIADVRLESHEVRADLRTLCGLVVDGERIDVELRLLGEAAAMNAAAALAVVKAVGLDPSRAARGLGGVGPTAGRLAPIEVGATLVLDDTYNANPPSTVLALDTGAALARARGARFVAALADMKELGERSASEHRAVGRHAARVGVDSLVLCGPEMGPAASAAAAERASLPVSWVPDAGAAASVLRPLVRDGDVVLVKGSRSMTMERVVEALGGEDGA